MFIPRSRNAQACIEWRKRINERDGHKCTKCGSGNNLVAHHVIEWKEAPHLRLDMKNGITLCKSCHIIHHRKGKKTGRVSWMKGKTHTEAVRKRISELAKVRKRKPHSEETKAKQRMNAGRPKGIPMTEETKAKLSALNKGKKLSAEHIAKIKANGGRPKGSGAKRSS